MVTRETAFIVNGCERCGGSLRGEMDDLRCFNCGRQPERYADPELMAMLRASDRRAYRHINGVYIAG